MMQSSSLVSFGWLIIAWASVDPAMNLIRVFFHLSGHESSVEYCTIAQAGHIFGRPRLFLALIPSDPSPSYASFCGPVGFKNLNTNESYLWYANYDEPHQHLSGQHLAGVGKKILNDLELFFYQQSCQVGDVLVCWPHGLDNSLIETRFM